MFKNYPALDVIKREESRLPERSRFYNLEPIGIGTNAVESFSGYISRLAQEHSVTPVTLIKHSVSSLDELPQTLRQNSLPRTFTANLNGFGEIAEKMTRIFQKATFRTDIEFTSLLVWKKLISNHGLLRKQQAWCPKCFQEQLITNGIVHEKLLWTFEVVEICLIHKIRLLKTCPFCSNRPKILSGKSRPGFCSKCLRWLGSDSISETIPEKSKEFWIAENIGKFLSTASQIGNSFSINLEQLIEKISDGNINGFAHLTGVWHLAIRRLLKREILPTTKMLIDVCYPLDFSPINLFINLPETKTARKIVKLKRKPFTKNRVKLKLDLFLAENPSLSANEIARRIGWTTTRFQRKFPDEYKKIVERYLQDQADKSPDYTDEQIEEILSNAATENPPRSLQSVFRSFGCRNTGSRYYRIFPELCEQIANRYKNANRKEFDLEKAKQILKSALKEKPTPSFSEVARRLNCRRENLNKRLPKLSAKLHKKFKRSIKKVQEQNKKQLCEEITRIINQLENQQKSVTENAVRKLLTKKWNDKNFKEAYKRITDQRQF